MAHSLTFTTSKVYHEDGYKFKILARIRLSDACKNGVCDFSITADIERQAKNGRWVDWGGGCCHDKVLKHFPQFEKFIHLHGCKYTGEPLYPVVNGMYFLKTKDINKAAEYLRITLEEAQTLRVIAFTEDKTYFKYCLFDMGIVARWKAEGDALIKELENLCGYTWENPYSPEEERFTLKPLTAEEETQVKERIKAGYFTPSAIQARLEDKQKAEREKARQEIINKCAKECEKAQAERDVMLAVLDFGINTDNVIYYSHSNKLAFNWKNYGEKISQEQYCDFVNNVDRSKLPENIIFEMK